MEFLTCPKCRGQMHQYERNGVVVDQCNDCRGIFLDRGELERLAEAESRWTERMDTPPSGQRQGYGSEGHGQRQGYESEGHGQRPRKKKKQWIEELFD